MLAEPPCYFVPPPSAIDRRGGEGGSSDVPVKAARLRHSPAEPRKEETRNKKGKEVGGQVDRLRRRDETRVALTADGHRDAPPWSTPRRKTTRRNYYGTSNGR